MVNAQFDMDSKRCYFKLKYTAKISYVWQKVNPCNGIYSVDFSCVSALGTDSFSICVEIFTSYLYLLSIFVVQNVRWYNQCKTEKSRMGVLNRKSLSRTGNYLRIYIYYYMYLQTKLQQFSIAGIFLTYIFFYHSVLFIGWTGTSLLTYILCMNL
jgi:hypothetical protein